MSSPNTHFGAEHIGRMLEGVDAIYFLGIGGISMSSLALMSARLGFRVAGYDRTRTALTASLEAEGIVVHDTVDVSHLDGFGAVVYTVAIEETHAEYAEAMRRHLPLISRADYLGYLMVDYASRIGIAGSHGKSTATCMCAQILMSAGADPTVMSGAAMRSMNGSVNCSMNGAFRLGGHDSMVFEACEYKDSFLDFYPNVAVILNAELDHVDYFRDMEQLRASFAAFADRAGRDGMVIYNADDEETVRAMASVIPRRVTFGRVADADYRAQNVVVERGFASFTLMHCGTSLGRIRLRVPGEHNVYNALAAAAAARECGICSRDIVRGLEEFAGAVRRMEYKGRLNGADAYDDYAHHPTEVEATVREAAQLGGRRLICAFQPHTYSRTAALFDRYVSALSESGADKVIIAPIYAAREVDTRGMSARVLAEAIGGGAIGCEDMDEVVSAILAEVGPGDTVVIMGAGDIDGIWNKFSLDEDA